MLALSNCWWLVVVTVVVVVVVAAVVLLVTVVLVVLVHGRVIISVPGVPHTDLHDHRLRCRARLLVITNEVTRRHSIALPLFAT